MTCPNHNHPDFIQLKDIFGAPLANYLYKVNQEKIPTPEQAMALLYPGKAQVSNSLRAWDTGSFSGKDQKQYEPQINELILKDPTAKVGGGESFNEVRDRAIAEGKRILDTAPANSLAVSHSTALKFIFLWDKAGRPADTSKITAKDYLDVSTTPGEMEKLKGANGTVFFVRHGETEDNADGNLRTDDTMLTDKGIKQAGKVAQELKGTQISQAFVSPLPRAVHTADIILQQQPKTEQVKEKVQPTGKWAEVRETAGGQRYGSENEWHLESVKDIKDFMARRVEMSKAMRQKELQGYVVQKLSETEWRWRKDTAPYLQISSKEERPVDVKLNKELAKFVRALKGEIRPVDKIVINGKTYDANAITDIINKTISIVEGKQKLDTLPEEVAHLFVEYLPKNSDLFKKMMADITSREIYDEVMEEYQDNELYQNADGSVNEDMIAREAIGKTIAKAITGQWESQKEKTVWQKFWNRLWSWIKDLIAKVKDFKEEVSPYETAASEILAGKTRMLDMREVAKAEKEGRYFLQMSAEQAEIEEYTKKLYNDPNTTDDQRIRMDQIVLKPKNKIILQEDPRLYTTLDINKPTIYAAGTKAVYGVKNMTDPETGTPKYEMNKKWGNYFDAMFRGVALGKGIDEIATHTTHKGVKQNYVYDDETMQAEFDKKFKQKAFDIAKAVYDNEVSDGSIVLVQPILSYKAPRDIDNIASSADFLVISPSGKVSNIDIKTSWHSIHEKNPNGKNIYDLKRKLEKPVKPEDRSWLLRDTNESVYLSKRDGHIMQLLLHQELLRKMGIKNFGNFRNYYVHLIADDNTNAFDPVLVDVKAEGFSKNQLDDVPRVFEEYVEKLIKEGPVRDPLEEIDPMPEEDLNPNPDELIKPLMLITQSLQKRKSTLLRNVKPETANKLRQTLYLIESYKENERIEALMSFMKYAQDFTDKGLKLTNIDYKKLTGESRRNYFKFLIEARDIANANLDLIPESVEVEVGGKKQQVPMLSLLNKHQRDVFNKLRADMNSLRIQSTLAMVNYVIETGASQFDIVPAPGQTPYDAAKEFLFKATHDITMSMQQADAPQETRDTLLGKINDIIRKADIAAASESIKHKNKLDELAKDYGKDLSKKENVEWMFDHDAAGNRLRLKQRISVQFLEEKRAIDESILNPDGTTKQFITNPQSQDDRDYNIELAKLKLKHRQFYDPETGINSVDQREGRFYHLTPEYISKRAEVMRYMPEYDKWVVKTGVSQEELDAFRNQYMIRALDYYSADRDPDTGEFTGTVSKREGWFPNRKYIEVNDNEYSYKDTGTEEDPVWEQVIERSLENADYKKLMATDTPERRFFVKYREMFEEAVKEGGPQVEEWYARGGLIALPAQLFDKGFLLGAGKLLKNSVSVQTIPQVSNRETTETGQLRHTLRVPFMSNLKNSQRILSIEEAIKTLESDFTNGTLRDNSGNKITTVTEKNKYKKLLQDKLKIENARKSASDLEVDPLKALGAFLEGVNTYKHMADIEGELLAMQQLVNQELSLDPNDKSTVRQYYGDEREFARRGKNTAFKEKHDIRSIAIVSNIIKNFYGEGVEKKTVDLIAKKFMTWTSASAMGLNIPNNFNNFILYRVNSLRQGMFSRFMSHKNMRKGFEEMNKNYFPGIAKKAFRKKGENSFDYKDRPESKAEAMMKKFNINAEEYFKQQGADSFVSKFYIGEQFAVQYSEYGMATGYMMDQILKDKSGKPIIVNIDGTDTTISMWNAYRFNDNTGDLELINQLKGRENEFEREEKNIVLRIKDIQIKTQGNYDNRSKTLLDNHLFGRLLLQFHRFWKPAWNDRFAKQYTHSSLGEMEGTWTSTLSVLKMVKEFDDHWTEQLRGGWKGFEERARAAGYTDERIELLKKNLLTDLAEIIIITSLFAMSYIIGKAAKSYYKKHPEVDENLKRFINYFQYTTSRIASEQMTYTPGVNLILLAELIHNPVAVSRTMKNFGKAVAATIQYPINEALGEHDANYYQKGIYAGKSKAYVRLRKSIPLWQVYDKWLMFSEMNDYENVLAGATGSAKSD